MKEVTVDAEEILVAYAGGKYYAIGGKCTHRGGDFSKGVLSGNVVKCPRHGARFDVTVERLLGVLLRSLS